MIDKLKLKFFILIFCLLPAGCHLNQGESKALHESTSEQKPVARDVLRKQISPVLESISKNVRSAQWQEALNTIEANRVDIDKIDHPLMNVRFQEVEALIGLSRIPEAVNTLPVERKQESREKKLIRLLALTLAREKNFQDVNKHLDVAYQAWKEYDQFKAKNGNKQINLEGFNLPLAKDHDTAVASVRILRAIEFSPAEAERELREALRLAPRHPFASYLLVESLVRQKRFAEAYQYRPDARKIGGYMGYRVQVVMDSKLRADQRLAEEKERGELPPEPPVAEYFRKLEEEINKEGVVPEKYKSRDF